MSTPRSAERWHHEVHHGGHYVYGQGSACVDQATVTFLTTGRLPHKKVYCTDVASQ